MKISAINLLLVILLNAGCIGSSQSTKKSYFDTDAEVTRCAAYCITWSNDGETCIDYNQYTTEHCFEVLTEQ